MLALIYTIYAYNYLNWPTVITQWSVFAIHNLTENNEENKQFVADLRLQGVANNQAVLEEYGIEVKQEGDKISVKKLKR